MEAKDPTGSHCGIKTMSHNTSRRTWFPSCVSSCCSASRCPRLPAFHHHWCLQSGTALNVFFWICFSENRIQITVLWLCSANWPLLWMTSMEWGWTNWRWKGGLGVGGRGKLVWPGAQCHTQMGRGEEGEGPGAAPGGCVQGDFFTLRGRRLVFHISPLPQYRR